MPAWAYGLMLGAWFLAAVMVLGLVSAGARKEQSEDMDLENWLAQLREVRDADAAAVTRQPN